jgi:hypothetical protein
MKAQSSLIQEFEMFDRYMSDIFFPGWEDVLKTDLISWHWKEFWSLYTRTN